MNHYLMIGRMKWLSAFLVVFAAFWPARAQEVVSYTISEGLAHTNVTTFFHDPDGYLWIGTWDGLSRFDGHNFTTYPSDVDGDEYFSRRTIQKIQKDNFGKIWVLTDFELVRYNAETNDFTNIELMYNPDPSKGGIPDLSFDDFGNGWCITDKGLYLFDPVTFSNRLIDISDFHVRQSRLLADEKGLWIAASRGLLHFPYSTLMEKDTLTVSDAEVWYSLEDHNYSRKASVIVRAENGTFAMVFEDLNRFTGKIFISGSRDSVLQEIPLPDYLRSKGKTTYLEISEISPNKILVTTDYPGSAVYELESGTYKYDHPLKELLKNRSQYHTYSDQQHNLWIGGIDGMFNYSLPQLNFKSWVFAPGKEGAISGKRISSVFKDKYNHLWVGSTDGGLDRIDLAENSIKKIALPDSLKMSAGATNVYNIFPLNDEELLVNFDTALFRYNIRQNRFSFLKTVDLLAYTFFRDSHNRIWISEKNKLVVLDFDVISEDTDFSVFDFYHNMTNTRQIYEARNGQFWLACGKGLRKLNFENPNESRVILLPGDLTESEVLCMHETEEGLLWLGTLRQGIFLFDPKTEQFKAHFSIENGLIDNSVNKIYEDKNGYLWMSTWKGLARLNTADSSIANYSVVNGLPFPEFNTNAHFMDEDGTIYFGGEGGVVAFHPDSLVNFEVNTRPGITAINAGFGLLPLDYPLRDGAVVKLAYNNNAFSVAFSAFDFRRPEQRMYRFRLAGHSDSWQVVRGNDLTAHFVGLKPGNYTFELQSTYKGWPWILEHTKIEIIISAPPFYLSGTFRVIVALLAALALLAVAFLLFRNFKIRKEVQISHLENETNQAKLNFLKTQMNPHSYFNTLNAINSFILDNDIRSANKYLATFSSLMRDILENSQKDFITVDRECEVLEKYLHLQQLRFPQLFEFTISREEEVSDMKIPPMIIQPFVENSVEYAFIGVNQKGMIQVKFNKSNGALLCEVFDNGIGIARSQEIKAASNRKSTALVNIARRIEILQNIYHTRIDLKIIPAFPENPSNPGARVILKLPDFRNRTAPAR
jgi:ligand-binding sensor domain-containing protein